MAKKKGLDKKALEEIRQSHKEAFDPLPERTKEVQHSPILKYPGSIELGLAPINQSRLRREIYRLCIERFNNPSNLGAQNEAASVLLKLVTEDIDSNRGCLILAANAILSKQYVEPGEM